MALSHRKGASEPKAPTSQPRHGLGIWRGQASGGDADGGALAGQRAETANDREWAVDKGSPPYEVLALAAVDG